MKAFQKYARSLETYLLKKYAKLFRRNCFQSIDELPIYNWWQIHSTRDFSFLLHKKRKVSSREQIILSWLWIDLYDQYLAEFGLNKDHKKIIETEQRLMELKLDVMESGDRHKYTFISIAEKELESMNKKSENTMSIHEACIHIERILHVTIDIEKCSVQKFHTFIKILEQEHGR